MSAASLALLTISARSASRTLMRSPGTSSTPTFCGSGMSGTVAIASRSLTCSRVSSAVMILVQEAGASSRSGSLLQSTSPVSRSMRMPVQAWTSGGAVPVALGAGVPDVVEPEPPPQAASSEAAATTSSAAPPRTPRRDRRLLPRGALRRRCDRCRIDHGLEAAVWAAPHFKSATASFSSRSRVASCMVTTMRGTPDGVPEPTSTLPARVVEPVLMPSPHE